MSAECNSRRRCNSPFPASTSTSDESSFSPEQSNHPASRTSEAGMRKESRSTAKSFHGPIHSTPYLPRSNSDSAIEISGFLNCTSESINRIHVTSPIEQSPRRIDQLASDAMPRGGEETRRRRVINDVPSCSESPIMSEEDENVIPIKTGSVSAPPSRSKSVAAAKPQPLSTPGTTSPLASRPNAAADETKEVPPITKLMQRTGYPIVQQNGQRRYGPPPNWAEAVPPRGCEVFVGKIPRDCFEDELVPVLEQAGMIYEMRLMVDFSGFNRGYAFVVYAVQSDARSCVRLFNNYEIRKGRLLGVCMSIDNCRLFIGGIPKRVVRDDILDEIHKVTEGVRDVIVYPSASDKTKNRGFAFIEYESHRSAAMARKKLISGRIQLWGHSVAVDWAEPEIEVEDEVMNTVKVIYVRNLMLSTTESQLEEVFASVARVERIKKIRDYAFVHFVEREGALKAIEVMNGKEIDGTSVEVTLAKPVDKDTLALHRQARKNRTYPQSGTLAPVAYVPVECGSYLAPLYGQCYHGERGFLSSRGRGKSYVRTRPPQRPAHSFSGSGSHGYMIPPGHSYQPSHSPTYMPCYDNAHHRGFPGRYECSHYEIPCHPEVSHGHLGTGHAPKMATSSIQALEDHCHKHHYGMPVYSLSTTAGPGDSPLYYYKVTISGLNLQFQANKLSHSVEEAKHIAAEHTIAQLTCPSEGSEMAHQAHPHMTNYVPVVTTPNIGKIPKIWDNSPAQYYHPQMEPTYQPGGNPYHIHHSHLGAGIWAPKGHTPAGL